MAEQQLVVFALGKEEFGIDISRVREIVLLQNITAILNRWIRGRNRESARKDRPIVDLGKRFLVVEREEG